MNEALQKAIDSLLIHDIYLRSAGSSLSEGFEPKYDAAIDRLDVQFRHVVTHWSILLLEEEGEEPISLFRVFVDLGVRWLEPGADDEDDEEGRVKARIEAVMVAEYQMAEDPGKESLKQFALRNASYHIWPYWREYLMGQCFRMNLPKLVLPAVQFAQNRATE
jgi:hypothetical protein